MVDQTVCWMAEKMAERWVALKVDEMDSKMVVKMAEMMVVWWVPQWAA